MFRPGFTCLAVLWILRSCQNFTYVTLTLFGWPSHAILLTLPVLKAVRTPKGFLLSVCPSSAFARHYLRNLV